MYEQTHRRYARNRQQKHNERLAVLKNVPCTDCGDRFPIVAMDFDHIRGTKVQNVGNMATYSDEKFLAEVGKCEVVCKNCHAVRTHARLVHR
jgi:hypothetical protein